MTTPAPVVSKEMKMITNTSGFIFTDPTNMVSYEPGKTVEGEATAWLMGQPVFKLEDRKAAK